MTKQVKSFRFSPETIKRLEQLSKNTELNQTTYLEQLIKREAEKLSKKS